MELFIGINIKWFIRLLLVGFWAVATYMAWTGKGFLTWMLTEHTSTSLFVLFLTFYYLVGPFYAPVLRIKKRTQGGEVLMEKSTKILLIIAALLGALVVAMAIEQSRIVIINAFKVSILNPIYGIGVRFNSWLATYPALWVLGSGLLSGVVLAIIINRVALPKLQKRVKKVPKPYIGGPEYVPPTVLPPATATTNPKPITTTPTPPPPTEKESTE